MSANGILFSPLESSSLHHTPGHVQCPACELYRRRILQPAAFGRMRFRDAAELWVRDHAANIAPKTLDGYRYYIRSLSRFFGELRLDGIHHGHIEAFRQERQLPKCDNCDYVGPQPVRSDRWMPCPKCGLRRYRGAGPGCINQQVNALKQIMERAGLWHEIAKFYRPLKRGKATVGQALEPEAEEKLFAAGAQNGRWNVALWVSVLTAATTAGPKEIFHLHVSDVDIERRFLRIRDGLKNEHRDRESYLNDAALWAVTEMLRRYRERCRRNKIKPHPEHYILFGRPARGSGKRPDPFKPQTNCRKSFNAMKFIAGLPTVRPYDLRHHAITKLNESADLTETVIEEQAGHAPNSKMQRHYTHARLEMKKRVAATLEVKIPGSQNQSSKQL